jgi:hypothetical protein
VCLNCSRAAGASFLMSIFSMTEVYHEIQIQNMKDRLEVAEKYKSIFDGKL